MRPPALLLAFLVLLAGCSLPFAPGPTATPSPAGTATPTPTPTPSFTFPEGYGPSAIDPAVAADTHDRAVLAAGSLTLSYTATVTGPNGTDTVELRRQVAFDRERLNETLRVESSAGVGLFERYLANGTVYVRDRPPGASEPTRTTRATRFDSGALTGVDLLAPALEGEFESGTVTTVDGEPAVRYEGTIGNASRLFGIDATGPLSVNVTVAESGVIRRVHYETTVGERSVVVDVTLTAGTGPVRRPAWLR